MSSKRICTMPSITQVCERSSDKNCKSTEKSLFLGQDLQLIPSLGKEGSQVPFISVT